jgi:hypothetical protein
VIESTTVTSAAAPKGGGFVERRYEGAAGDTAGQFVPEIYPPKITKILGH